MLSYALCSSRRELRQLLYFLAVAEEENVSAAALKLHVSQPALSTQLLDQSLAFFATASHLAYFVCQR